MRCLKIVLFLVFCSFFKSNRIFAQQAFRHNEMTYSITNKPNTIIYNDTIYKGSKAFKQLFLRTKDIEIIDYYKKHQSNKIIGNIVTTAGTAALTVGIIYANSRNSSFNKTTSWILVGSGLATSVLGGYFITQSAKNLYFATVTFNKKQLKKTNASIGISENGLAFTVKL